MVYMLTWDKYLGDFFMTWKEDGYSLKHRTGEVSIGDEPCDAIEVFAPTGNQQFRYYFSKKTGLLEKKQWRSDGREGPVQTELFFSEYRKVNNLKDPTKPIRFAFKPENTGEISGLTWMWY